MPAAVRSLATFEDLLRLDADARVEVVDGAIVERASPTFEHSLAQVRIGGEIGGPFGRRGGPRGPGGWWIGSEVDVEYGPHDVYRHDLAGWRRDVHAARPSGRPVRQRPDWVCEVLSPSNAKTDLVDKMRTLHRCGVPHYWIADPMSKVLTVHRHGPAGYITVTSASSGELIRAEPFDAIEIRVAVLLGDEDPPED